MLSDENKKRFIVILNKKIETWKLFNALAHMTAGFWVGKSDNFEFVQYFWENTELFWSISNYPFIVLKADNGNQIRTVKNECVKRNISFSIFTDTMRVGTTQEQLELTKNTRDEDLEYFWIIFFGETQELQEFTKKYSLFK